MKLNHSSILLAIVFCLLSGYMVSCWSAKEHAGLGNTGATSAQLTEAADKQKSATDKIDTEATSIEATTKEKSSKNSPRLARLNCVY